MERCSLKMPNATKKCPMQPKDAQVCQLAALCFKSFCVWKERGLLWINANTATWLQNQSLVPPWSDVTSRKAHRARAICGRLAIWSTCHLIDLPFDELAIWTSCHLINWPFDQLAIWSSLDFHRNCCLADAIWSINHLVSLCFDQPNHLAISGRLISFH